MTHRMIVLLGLLALAPGEARLMAGPSGSFIQLNRACAGKSEDAWRADMVKMRAIGIRSLIVQWCAEPGISYVTNSLAYAEQYEAVNRILAAARSEQMEVHLGLHHDPHYWVEITGRDKVLADYFLARVSINERLQKALLTAFGSETNWVGYYIPDEIDDLTWRQPGRVGLIRNYVALMCERLRANDPGRSITISAFMRPRTEPNIFARHMRDIMGDSQIDRLLIQDGMGSGGPDERYISLYYKILQDNWKIPKPALGCVLEAFAQTSAPNEPFAAVPASPARMRQQIKIAEEYFEDLVLFTFSDYADPDLNPEAALLYEALKRGSEPAVRSAVLSRIHQMR